MPPENRPILIATRGSALALAQSNHVLAQCRATFPALQFELLILKTTGDKLQTASLANAPVNLPKGLFTKELEVALLENRADLAVHSLKDLPTQLPDGLILGAVGRRADVRDVLIYRDTTKPDRRGFPPKSALRDLPQGATVATSSTRRKSQMLDHRPDLNIVEIRGNVATRMIKLAEQPELDATILAAAGLERLHFKIQSDGRLIGDGVPDGLLATILETTEMLPCVGQGAIGIETRVDDARIIPICERLNHFHTQQCATAERAFLAAMGGGCQSPIGACAEIDGDQIRMRVVSFRDAQVRRAEAQRSINEPVELGRQLAGELTKPG